MPELVENLATAALTVLALALFVVAVRAWWHTRSGRVLYLSLGFGLFLVKGIVLSVGLFTWSNWEVRLFLFSIVVDLLVLGMFYLAVLKRPGA
jgi:hypothetical protein